MDAIKPIGIILGAVAMGFALYYAVAQQHAAQLQRPNFQGRSIPTAAGIAFVMSSAIAITAGVIFTPGTRMATEGAVYLYAIIGFGVLGFLDDYYGDRSVGGLKGHFKALLGGKVTTGAVKAIGGVALACWLAWMVDRPGAAHTIASAVVIAGSANALNLLDLRPGRSLTAFFAGILLLAAVHIPGYFDAWWTGCAGLATLSALGLFAVERNAKCMLGDTGANSFGAALGVSFALYLPTPLLVVMAALIVAFHVWTEKHSVSKFIEAHPYLRAIDRLIGVR
jgi:UDP-N-acetylmuramyl pentapeptide phosphotransferase/UDP-N-acetylglucosamine-1-phosphate transferase